MLLKLLILKLRINWIGMVENFFRADTLDDLMHYVLDRLLSTEQNVEASRGRMRELFGATLILSNPRARLSRTESKGRIFSALGELLWYLSGRNDLDFIKYYVGSFYEGESEDGKTVRSGYGERLYDDTRSIKQIENVIELLSSKPSSRRAVIQIFDASDLKYNYKSIPCTCTLQFLLRDKRLNLLVNMRSNDAFWGLPHDVFAFTMLQEIVARSLEVDVGIYQQCIGSLHLYEDKVGEASRYVDEGFMSAKPMNPMPLGNPWTEIEEVRAIADQVREGKQVDVKRINAGSYWRDICVLLVWLQQYKDKNIAECLKLKREIQDKAYYVFLDDKLASLKAP